MVRLQFLCQDSSARGSQGTFCTAQSKHPSVSLLLIIGCICMDVKTSYFCRATARDRKKHLLLLTRTNQKYLLDIINMIWLPLLSCVVFLLHFCRSFFFSRIKYLRTPSRFGSYTYPRQSYLLFSE